MDIGGRKWTSWTYLDDVDKIGHSEFSETFYKRQHSFIQTRTSESLAVNTATANSLMRKFAAKQIF